MECVSIPSTYYLALTVEEDFMARAKKGYRSQDQDVINGACYGYIKFLPYKYNCMMAKYEGKVKLLLNCFSVREIFEAHNRPLIIHYAAEEKPWESFECALSDRWWKYAKKAGVDFKFLAEGQEDFIRRGKINRLKKTYENELQLRENEKIIERLNKDLYDIRHGYSFRIGRIVTWFPRKVYGGIKCLQWHGLTYTMKRTLEHLGIDMGTGDFSRRK